MALGHVAVVKQPICFASSSSDSESSLSFVAGPCACGDARVRTDSRWPVARVEHRVDAVEAARHHRRDGASIRLHASRVDSVVREASCSNTAAPRPAPRPSENTHTPNSSLHNLKRCFAASASSSTLRSVDELDSFRATSNFFSLLSYLFHLLAQWRLDNQR